MAKTYKYTLVDIDGYKWAWNGQRVFIPEADAEFRAQGIPVTENGYPATTWRQAQEILIQEGYLEDFVKE